MTAGAVSGAVAGQAGRAAGNVLSGRSVTEGLGNQQDIARDAATGGLLAGAGYAIGQGAQALLTRRLQSVTNAASQELSQNPAVASNYLSGPEYTAGQRSASVARMQYGNALERMVAGDVRNSFVDSRLFRHASAPGQAVPDFVGRGPFSSMGFDITTNNPQTIANHLSRSYGRGLRIITYERPAGFGVFE